MKTGQTPAPRHRPVHELEAFAQFATDMDPQTRQQIERGRRIVGS
jgi:F0F1-type ATP synthase alpha subunit